MKKVEMIGTDKLAGLWKRKVKRFIGYRFSIGELDCDLVLSPCIQVFIFPFCGCAKPWHQHGLFCMVSMELKQLPAQQFKGPGSSKRQRKGGDKILHHAAGVKVHTVL